MIKLSNAIPEIVPDGSNPQAMMEFLTQAKLCIEELASKAQPLQMEERTTAPTADDIQEKEHVYATIAGLRYIYTKMADGTVHFIAVT